MDEFVRYVMQQRAEKTIEALRKNQMLAEYVPDRKAAVDRLVELLPKGCTVTHGGSVTLNECGIPDLLRKGDYEYWDRNSSALSYEEKQEIQRRSFCADYFLGSANAITENGEIFNVDGNGNRVAAYIYGPKHVILIAGVNKLVPDIDAALSRLQKVTAPANTRRLNYQTPCAKTGICINCRAPGRICCNYVVQGFQRDADRIHVLLVGENLGY